jgi:hypothetical protein
LGEQCLERRGGLLLSVLLGRIDIDRVRYAEAHPDENEKSDEEPKKRVHTYSLLYRAELPLLASFPIAEPKRHVCADDDENTEKNIRKERDKEIYEALINAWKKESLRLWVAHCEDNNHGYNYPYKRENAPGLEHCLSHEESYEVKDCDRPEEKKNYVETCGGSGTRITEHQTAKCIWI